MMVCRAGDRLCWEQPGLELVARLKRAFGEDVNTVPSL